MRILQAMVYQIQWPFKLAVKHSLADNSTTNNLIVELIDDQGCRGYGEGVPREYVTGENMTTALSALSNSILPPLITYKFQPEQATRVLTDLVSQETIDRTPAAGCAVETALLDLAGQSLGVSVTGLLGQARVESMTYSGVIPLAGESRTKWLLKSIKALELDQVKIKVDGKVVKDRVAMVRQYLGDGVRLRVDANAAWMPEEAVGHCRDLARLGVDIVEQPVPKGDVAGLAYVNDKSELTIMADESVCTIKDAADLIACNAVGAFNLRLSKCGGLVRAREIMELAGKAGLICQLGCQVGELGILSAAGRHFAAVYPELVHLEGSLTNFLIGRDVLADDLTFGQKGVAFSLPGSGLGVNVLSESLRNNLVLKIT